jgi:hypothetical protein
MLAKSGIKFSIFNKTFFGSGPKFNMSIQKKVKEEERDAKYTNFIRISQH